MTSLAQASTAGIHVHQFGESVEMAMKAINKNASMKSSLQGFSTGLIDLDSMTDGFKKGELIVLAGRTSMGKTALALNIVEAVALPQKSPAETTLIFSLGCRSAALAKRMIVARSKVPLVIRPLTNPAMQRLDEAANELTQAPIYIDDSGQLTVVELCTRARQLHAHNPLGFVVIDNFHRLTAPDPTVSLDQQVTTTARMLKELAEELTVPVLVICQLNRSAENAGRLPRLSDIGESGMIEQEADLVLIMNRPPDADPKFQVAPDTTELIVAKNRDGSVGELKLTFRRDFARFENFQCDADSAG